MTARVSAESGWSPRFAFMTVMSAGIAVLGLLLSSPAVVIGAMLISPLMGPILGLGFSLALFDAAGMRRAVTALLIATVLAVGFAALIVLFSPLKGTTAEILARTRPNLFDLLVALFSALAGAYALIRERDETIVGVAIATALMPPLATIGYGLATANWPIAGGAFALFVTNLVTIALAATIMARLYGFGHRLSSQQSWMQSVVLVAVFALMAIPLAISLNRIAWEAVVAAKARGALIASFEQDVRITQFDIDYDASPLAIRAVVIVPRSGALPLAELDRRVEAKLGQPVSLQADEVLVDPSAATLEQERAALERAQEQRLSEQGAEIARLVAVAAGAAPEEVMLDREARRVLAAARPLPGASLSTYRTLESRAAAQAKGWSVAIMPPTELALPAIVFADGSDALDATARAAIITSAWAAQRWNWAGLAVPGLVEPTPERPTLAQRRAAAIAAVLREAQVQPLPGSSSGSGSRMILATPAAVTP